MGYLSDVVWVILSVTKTSRGFVDFNTVVVYFTRHKYLWVALNALMAYLEYRGKIIPPVFAKGVTHFIGHIDTGRFQTSETRKAFSVSLPLPNKCGCMSEYSQPYAFVMIKSYHTTSIK